MVVLWWLDRCENEPLWLLSILLLWGAMPTVALSMAAQLVLDAPLSALLGPSALYEAAQLSVIAPLTEESFKALYPLLGRTAAAGLHALHNGATWLSEATYGLRLTDEGV